MSAYAGCSFCGGRMQGCLHCDAERQRDAQFHGAKDPATINVHLNDPRDAEAVRNEIRRRTGREPLFCIHLYADSLADLRAQLEVRERTSTVQQSRLEKLFADAGGVTLTPVDSPELIEARRKLSVWQDARTSYGIQQRGHWQREVLRLEAERDAVPVPEDSTQDADDEQHEDHKPDKPTRGTKRSKSQ